MTNSNTAVDLFSAVLAAEADPAKRTALMKRVQMKAANEPDSFKPVELLSPDGLAAERKRQFDAAVTLIGEHGYSENIGRLTASDPNAVAARAVIARELTSRLGMTDDAAKLLITRVAEQPEAFEILTAEQFGAVEEDGAGALLGSGDLVLIPENSDSMFRGNGGAGKTTLTMDMAFHFASGDPWLGIPIDHARRVLLIENEGPAALFRQKVERKRKAWTGRATEDRLKVFNRPWHGIDLNSEAMRVELARAIADDAIDVVIAGPLTRLGMNEAGTLQQVRDFMKLVADVRTKAGRPVTFVLIHHDNKAGSVSGAWEWATDSLFDVSNHVPGHTELHVEKARWHRELHGQRLKLTWTDGEGFELVDDRNYLAELERLLDDGYPRTVDEISAPKTADFPGVGADKKLVKKLLTDGLLLKTVHELTPAQAKAVGRDKVANNGKYFCSVLPETDQTDQHGF